MIDSRLRFTKHSDYLKSNSYKLRIGDSNINLDKRAIAENGILDVMRVFDMPTIWTTLFH